MQQQDDVIIRPMLKEDYPLLLQLMQSVGYTLHLNELEERLNAIYSDADYMTYVLLQNDEVIGMVGMEKMLSYEESGLHIRIRTLIVPDKYKNQGHGYRLLKTAEEWAKHIGARKVHLNCQMGKGQAEMHAFYIKKGYIPKSTGMLKKL